MRTSAVRSMLLATAFVLTGCGGGGGGGYVASTPPPPVTPTATPTPTPAIIPAATTSQKFTVMGASHSFDGDQTPLLGDADQLQVRYIVSSNSYEVQLPHSPDWAGIHPSTSNNFEGAAALSIRGGNGTQYSSLFSWSDGATFFGYEAIGVATPAGGVPVTGNASYSGQIWGATSETYLERSVSIFGGIQLSFDFGRGSLSGSVRPEFFSYATYDDYTGTPINFRDTVYSAGSATFSGKFDTNLPGLNSFSGLFTGPNAQELIGNFALPYVSPIDSQTYQASGAFVAKK